MFQKKLLGALSLLAVGGALMFQTNAVRASETRSVVVPSAVKASPMYGQGLANAMLAGYVGGAVAGCPGVPEGMAAGAIGGMLGGAVGYGLTCHPDVVAPLHATELD